MDRQGRNGRDMRIGWLAATAAALLAGLAGSVAAWATSGITGSPHDLRGRPVSTASQICMYCHVPETVDAAGTTSRISRRLGNSAFSAYGDSAGEDPSTLQPLGVSLVCLSCHDGTIAWDTLAGGISASALGRAGGLPAGTGGLASSHPVSVSYYEGYDATFRPPIRGRVGKLPLFPASGAGGAGDRVECASCHNPHEIIFGKFLRISNTNGALCFNCHDK
jgi:predicted CXXCH cytochrome family protein